MATSAVEEVRREGDDWDAHWDDFSAAAERNPAQRYRRWLTAHLLERQGTPVRILDVGSGTGDFAVDAHHRWPGSDVLGLEYSASGVKIAQRKAPDATFRQVDLLSPDATPRTAHVAWATHALCSEVLEHVDDPVTLMRNARAWMAPQCRVVLTVPGGPMSAFDRHIGHRRHFRPSDLAQVLDAAGFQTVLCGGAGFPFFNVYRGVVIARGERLTRDVSEGGATPAAASAAMRIFDGLFRLNLPRSRFGWQTFAVAYPRP